MSRFALMTLGPEGVITDPYVGLNYIMSCFFFSLKSQTDLYQNHVISLSNLIKQSGDSSTAMARLLEEKLSELLSRHYDSVVIEVEAVEEGVDIHLSVRGTVTTTDSQGDRRIDLGYGLTVANDTFKKIVDHLNSQVIY